MSVEGVQRRMLVDTGCPYSVDHISCCKAWRKSAVNMVTVSGEEWQCEGTGTVLLQVSCGAYVDIYVIVTASKPLGFSFLLRMDGIKALGGVTVNAQGKVYFGVEKMIFAASDTVLKVDESDFSATYDPSSKSWTIIWKWAGGREPDILCNKVDAYSVPEGARIPY